jgi:hypothetical protein
MRGNRKASSCCHTPIPATEYTASFADSDSAVGISPGAREGPACSDLQTTLRLPQRRRSETTELNIGDSPDCLLLSRFCACVGSLSGVGVIV